MPDWPTPRAPQRPLIFTNITEWVRRTGRAPDFSSATFSMAPSGFVGGVACPVYIPVEMTVRSLYCANGATVAGLCRMALGPMLRSFGTTAGIPGLAGGIQSEILPQAGVNTWQEFPVSPQKVQPGLYWLAYVSSVSTGTVQQLYAPLGATSGEAWTIFIGVKWPTFFDLVGSNAVAPVVPIMAVGGVG